MLAHNYQTPEIFHCVADFVGDSLALARQAKTVEAKTIVLAGVFFMAETAKILNPEKTVLIPNLAAGCSLANSITCEDVRLLRASHPGVPIVAYVNTSAAVKAEADICCTSANARAIVESLGTTRVILLPDEYLAQNVASETDVEVLTWAGHCEVHERFTAAEVKQLREDHPGVIVLAHPECPPDVVAESNFSGSTAAMSGYVRTKRPLRVVLLTECPMSDNVAVDHPDQFHPTALATSARPMILISEAVRGEGAILIDELGHRFLIHEPGAELATRDVVARAISQRIAEGHRVFLDARRKPGSDFAVRFPRIAAACRAVGLDPARTPIPIRPAAHYHMGGVAVDAVGRTSINGLWACGEVASNGFHGANRLASNSLIEVVVCAGWVAQSVAGAPRTMPKRGTASIKSPLLGSDPSPVRPVLSRFLGVLRDGWGLREAISRLRTLVPEDGPSSDPATVGLMLAVAALRREESRRAHFRADFPHRSSMAWRSSLRLDEALDMAREVNALSVVAQSA